MERKQNWLLMSSVCLHYFKNTLGNVDISPKSICFHKTVHKFCGIFLYWKILLKNMFTSGFIHLYILVFGPSSSLCFFRLYAAKLFLLQNCRSHQCYTKDKFNTTNSVTVCRRTKFTENFTTVTKYSPSAK